MAAMSSQEVVFWISLFGLDFGIPLMLPEHLRFRIGAVATALSATGLAWSLGYKMSLVRHIGWRAALVFTAVGGVSLLLATVRREATLALTINDVADLLQGYVTRTKRDYPGEIGEVDWRKILGRYRRNKLALAISAIQETAIRHFKDYKLLKHPNSLDDMQASVDYLNKLADSVHKGKYRIYRLILGSIAGGILGLVAFAGFRFIVETFQL
jgi:hypothetical protein